MIKFSDHKGLSILFRLMFYGSIISITLVTGYSYYQKYQYPKLTSIDEINGIITNLSVYQSVVKFQINHSEKYMIVDSRNYAYNPYTLQKILHEGDYMEKNINNDTIHVKRRENSWIFVIGKELNKELRTDL
ncbi:MAG: hypothetical protein OEX22_08460 [Cyclobacteriaceae bacterium]|nr:hypothetical protein [Cyclobacteriaceae bacterium]